jgi:hypothetical protein
MDDSMAKGLRIKFDNRNVNTSKIDKRIKATPPITEKIIEMMDMDFSLF